MQNNNNNNNSLIRKSNINSSGYRISGDQSIVDENNSNSEFGLQQQQHKQISTENPVSPDNNTKSSHVTTIATSPPIFIVDKYSDDQIYSPSTASYFYINNNNNNNNSSSSQHSDTKVLSPWVNNHIPTTKTIPSSGHPTTTTTTIATTTKTNLSEKSLPLLLVELVENVKREEILNEIARASNRVCNTLILFQTIANNPEYRILLVNAKIFVYIYPFLKTVAKTKPFEYLRFSSLSVISSIIKVEIKDVLKFLLESDISVPCLKIMEFGSELSKTVSTFIIQKLLNEDEGLNYFSNTPIRLKTIFCSLNAMVEAMLPDKMSSRLLKHIIRCYLRLSDNSRAREMLSSQLPLCFSNGQLNDFLNQEGDMIVKRWFHQLMSNVNPPPPHPRHSVKRHDEKVF
ncbi:cell differentiation family [Cavenderia fasciculata]|uniref:Cell differentiation family n=1 Tax=Cavenderia fasciculata TaxID=261658 RepID=F4QBI5_CACFS|nr:cell differentiation family [Cavenderia fasciculata]EGG14957.1 cell differentiation family [Cavenderia fasciculata]|eukprot:XP_004351473.1 cell differentiation family [Cavenderia fasciculata]